MGIRLDWQVESEAGSEAVAEDAAVLAAQRRQRIRVRRLILILTPMLIALAALGWWRMRVTEAARREALIAVVEAEMLALRLGDPHKFSQFQAPANDWRRHQTRNFAEFQAHVPAVTMTSQIVEMEMQGAEARVSVRVLIGDVPEIAVWLYAYSAEKGWQHVSTEAEPWVRESLHGAGYRIDYYQADEALARQVDLLIGDWWEDANRLTGVDHPMPLVVLLDPYSDSMVVAAYGLIIPTATQTDGLLDAETVRAMRTNLAAQWALYVLGDPVIRHGDEWVITETTRWLYDSFTEGESDQPPADVFFALSGAFGHRYLPTFFAMMRADAPSVRDALRESMTAHGPYAGRTDGLLRYLGYAIRAEIAFHNAYEISDSNPNDGPAPMTRALFMNEQRSLWSRAVGGRLPYDDVVLDSVQILAVEQMEYSDLLWVTAEMLAGGETITVRVPFIFKDGYWVHTWATERDWGAAGTGETFYMEPSVGNTVLSYHALDEANISGDVRARLDTIATQASNDFGLSPQLVQAYIGPSFPRIAGILIDGEMIPVITASVDSVYMNGWLPAGVSPSEYYEERLATEMVVTLYQTTLDPVLTWSTPIDYGIMHWEMRHLGVDGEYSGKPEIHPLPYTIDKIEDLFVLDTPLTGSAIGAYSVGADVLIEMLMERYGIEMLPEMIANLRTAQNADDWMLDTFGIRSEQLQEEWYERYQQRLEDYETASP